MMRTDVEIERRLKEKLHIWKISNKGKNMFKSRRWKMKGEIKILEWLKKKKRIRKEVEMLLTDKKHIFILNDNGRNLFKSTKWKMKGEIKTLKWVLMIT